MKWGQRWWAAGALLSYLVLALWWTYPLVFHAGTHIATPIDRAPLPHKRPLARAAYNDQLLTISGLTRNADALMSLDPAGVYAHRVCYPTPGASFLGEHMIESALLGLPAYAASRSPTAAYNLAALLATLIAAMSMFLLIRYWTDSPLAGFIAGLLFAFHPGRLDNLTHLAVVGIHWLPLVLLCFERLLDEPRPRRAMALLAVATLQALVGSYPLLVLACFTLPYGCVRLAQRRRSIGRAAWAYLGATVLICTSLVALVLAPYAVQQRVWDVLRLRWTILAGFTDYLPGQRFAVGVVILPLAAAAALPSARRWAAPAIAILVATLACVLVCTAGPLWTGGPVVPSVYLGLSRVFEFLAFIRAPVSIRSGVYMGLAMLAGLGVAGLLARTGQRTRPWMAALVALAILTEVFEPWIASAVYTRTRLLSVESAVPDSDILEAFATLDQNALDGAILDIPYSARAGGQLEEMPLYLHESTFFPKRTTAACYNSYPPPSHFEVARLAALLPSSRGISESAAAGLANLLVHRKSVTPAFVHALEQHDDLRVVYDAGGVVLFRNVRQPVTHSDAALLRFESLGLPTSLRAELFLPALYLTLRNTSTTMWALKAPITPLTANVRFVDTKTGTESEWYRHRLLLPLALAAGETASMPIVLSRLPAPGSYQVELKIPALGWDLAAADTVVVLPSERVVYTVPW